jgi:hypothetical protein
MKKFSIILLGTLVILMAGCSKNNATESVPAEDAWVNNLDLPVPIVFGNVSTNPLSKIAIDDESIQTLRSRVKFGIFGLETDYNREGKDAWTSGSESVLLNNVPAYYNNGSMVFGSLNSPVTYYYPMYSNHNFTFYGCHSDATSVISDGNSMRLSVTFGDTDIIWAKSEAVQLPADSKGGPYDGFNARYIRAAKRASVYEENMPSFKFRHLTSRLRFTVMASEDADYDKLLATKVKVTGLSLVGTINSETQTPVPMHKSAYLCVADRLNPDNEGKFFVTGTQRGEIAMMYRNADGSGATTDLSVCGIPHEYTPAAGVSSLKELGEGLFIFPMADETADGSLKIRANVKISFPVNGSTNKIFNKTFDLPYIAENSVVRTNGFQAGYMYHYVIKINSPEDIEIKCEVMPWIDAFGGGNDLPTIE